MNRLVAVGMVLAVVAAGCGGEATTTTTSPIATTPQSTTTTAPATTAQGSTTTTATTTVDTEAAPPVTEAPPPPNAAPAYAITQVAFGAGAFVQITNTGNAPGDIGGHWLCQRPVYFEIPSTELGPGQSVWVAADGNDIQFVGDVVGVVDAAGRLGSFAVGTGEMALYSSNDFSDAAAIVDYVEWGTGGHGRSAVAVEAGIWTAGGFVETTEDTIAINSGEMGADDPAGWAPDIGVSSVVRRRRSV
jgi:hypothetical protein